MNEIMQSLLARKSVRVFEAAPVSAADRQAILEAAFQAPTAGNQMMYTILDITDPALKRTLSELCDHQPFIATAPLVLVFLADCRRWLDAYRAAGLAPRAPGQGDILLAASDAVIAAQNAVVAAESLGLGSCYIGDILENCEQVRAALSLPEEVLPAAMLVIGVPTAQQKAREKPARFEERYIVMKNAYRTLSPEEHRDMLRDRFKDFDAGIRAFCERKYESDFAREMNRSVAAYLRAFAEN